MIQTETRIRVRYGESDPMGYAHHANYPLYLEEARMDFLRKAGIDYASLEDQGIIMPLINMNFRFIKPFHFNDLMLVRTSLEAPVKLKVRLKYRIVSEKGDLHSEAETTLVFAEKVSGKPIRPPVDILQKLYST